MNNLMEMNMKRLLILGERGKTTFLYWNKLREKVNSIPTIGFNTETIKKGDYLYNCWDIGGGCGGFGYRLVKHYYHDIDGIIFMIDSSDRDNLEYSLNAFLEVISQSEFPKVPISIFCTFRDLPNCVPYKDVLGLLMPIVVKIKDQPFMIQFGTSFGIDDKEAEGHKEIWIWFEYEFQKKIITQVQRNIQKILPKPKTIETKEVKKLSNYNFMKIDNTFGAIVPDSKSDIYDNEEFIKKIENFELNSWDHKTHLRLAYIILKKDGRRNAVPIIFKLIEDFIKNSISSNGKRFHVTMTYFWIHMVYFAMILNPDDLFEQLLGKSSWLLNGRLFSYFYSDELMLKNEESRKIFHPPDIQHLPDVLLNESENKTKLKID